MIQPEVILFGGCNGAGKTTLAFQLLGKGLHLHEFVNADEIAHGLNPLNPSTQTGLASRLAIQRVQALISEKRSFSFEGTLAGTWQAKTLTLCVKNGYHTRLIYVWLSSVAIARQRVRNRVQQGGHDVPADLIERRYYRGLANLHRLYLPVVHEALILDGSDLNTSSDYRIIAQKQNNRMEIILSEKWSLLCQNLL